MNHKFCFTCGHSGSPARRGLVAVISFCLMLAGARAGEILSGAGATFPAPLYKHWFELYQKQTGVGVTYEAVGSGRGTAMLLEKQMDFGASDAFMPDEDLVHAPAAIVHIPTCIGAIAIICNLPELKEIRLPPEVLADLLRGRVTHWNAPMIAAANPEVTLPNRAVVVVHRSDSSGTTFILSDYLTKVSRAWRNTIGRGKTLKWPVGYGAAGNVGVAETVARIPGAIGYAELAHASSRDLLIARIRNRHGDYVPPNPATAALAAKGKIPADLRVYLSDADVPGAYPITGFTWLLCYTEQAYAGRSEAKARRLVELLWWITHEAQTQFGGMAYAPLPPEVVVRTEEILRSFTCNGAKVLEKQP